MAAYVRKRTEAIDEGDIGIKSRAAVIHAAHGRCEMCGEQLPRMRLPWLSTTRNREIGEARMTDPIFGRYAKNAMRARKRISLRLISAPN